MKIQVFACSQCGTMHTPPNGYAAGRCGLRRGLGVPPAKICDGVMVFLGCVELTDSEKPAPEKHP